jgi:hypothetical protein
MKRALAMLAVMGMLAVPVLVSAQTQGDARVPPEAKWTSTPPTPPLVAVDQPRTVSTAQDSQEQLSTSSRSATVSEKAGYFGYWDPDITSGD